MMSIAMIKKLKHSLLSVLALSFVASSLVFVPPASAAPAPSCPERVLTFPAWYKGVIDRGTCEVKITSVLDLIVIPLNFIEILIQAVAYVAVGFIVWGGFKYIKSQGDPGKISESKTAIINAVTGLGIALLSVAIVEFVQGRFS